MEDKLESEWENSRKIARNLDPLRKDLPRTLVVQIMEVRQLERIADALDGLGVIGDRIERFVMENR